MKVFTPENGSFTHSINFADANNVVVGFDLYHSCCESFGWAIVDKIPESCPDDEHIDPGDLDPYVFDISYINEEPMPEVDFDGGGAVAFRLTDGDREKFLILWNHHNGYYSHGFGMKCGDANIHQGSV